MSRAWRLLLGLASILPLLSLLLYAASFETVYTKGMVVALIPAYMAWIIGPAIILGFGLWLFYAQWIVRSRQLTAWSKAAWVFLLAIGSVVSMPALWYIHFRPGSGSGLPDTPEAA